jgi:hypothetical protein
MGATGWRRAGFALQAVLHTDSVAQPG